MKTRCDSCQRTIEAQAFIWERELDTLTGRIYSCPHCKDSGERPATPEDVEQARRSSSSALHRSRALERVAALHDPDRAFVEEAFEVYPARALNALLKLVNRIERMETEPRWLAGVLLLAAFDQANGLWHYPTIRSRPKQLGLPVRYLEKNIWLALEDCVVSWPKTLEEAAIDHSPIECTIWPALPTSTRGICLYAGHLKALASELGSGSSGEIEIQAVLGVLPRYNQAFWTLSALWAGWLWGKTAIADFKGVLRRRRYDWSWHLMALHASLSSLMPHLKSGTPCLGLIAEAEPMFISSALLSAELSGFSLQGIALRSGQEQAQISWIRSEQTLKHRNAEADHTAIVKQGITNFLAQNGEPAAYLRIHTAALQSLIRAKLCAKSEINSPLDVFHQADQAIENAMRMSGAFKHFSTTSRSIDTGQWWLNEQVEPGIMIQASLADRVENAVLRILQGKTNPLLSEIDAEVCSELSGLHTPDLDLITECVHSYGYETDTGSNRWSIRHQDEPELRRVDLGFIADALNTLGESLGFQVRSGILASDQIDHPFIFWQDPWGERDYEYILSKTGVVGGIISHAYRSPEKTSGRVQEIIVLPGSRARLLEFKIQRDPNLQMIIEEYWLIIKFRHVRWLAENEQLNRDNYTRLLRQDPLANQDPQLPLL